MPVSKENYKTYIQFIKPCYVRDAYYQGVRQSSKAGLLKSVRVAVPEHVSEDLFCTVLVPEQFILDIQLRKKNIGYDE